MGLIITPQAQIDAYFASPALSQSTLKELQYGLDKFLAVTKRREEVDDSDKFHFLFGGAVDTILTGEEGAFEEKYFISSLDKKPSDMEVNIVQFAFDEITREISSNMKEIGILEDYPGFVKNAIDFYGWQPKWKEDTKINKIIEVGSSYFEDLKLAFGKKILSSNQYDVVKLVINSFRTNKRTSHLFDREALAEFKNLDIYYQLPIYFEINGVKCKALLDLVAVWKDDEGKVLAIQPFDIKTKNGFTIDFPNSAKSFRYDIQGSWYSDAILNESAIFPEGFPKFEKDIELKPFTFVVESSTDPGKPLLFKANDEFLNTGRYGRVNPQTGKPINKGYISLLEDFVYHSKTNWTEERIVTENNGVLELGWDGITESYE